jgi:protein-tyrosine-phosphatase
LSSIDPLPQNEKYIDKFIELANLSIPMLQKSIQAYVQRDEKLAREVMLVESQADAVRSAINSDLLSLQQRGEIPLEALASLFTIARRFERTTDQAKNICEEVVYIATGEVVKHQGLDQFRILFVDEDNSCLSQMAEGIAKSLKLPKFSFSSVGFKSSKPVDQRLIAFMAAKGIDISTQTSKTIDQIPQIEYFEVMIALSPSIQDILPPTATRTIKLFWPVRNNRKKALAEEVINANFEKAFRYFMDQIHDLVHVILGENNE